MAGWPDGRMAGWPDGRMTQSKIVLLSPAGAGVLAELGNMRKSDISFLFEIF